MSIESGQRSSNSVCRAQTFTAGGCKRISLGKPAPRLSESRVPLLPEPRGAALCGYVPKSYPSLTDEERAETAVRRARTLRWEAVNAVNRSREIGDSVRKPRNSSRPSRTTTTSIASGRHLNERLATGQPRPKSGLRPRRHGL